MFGYVIELLFCVPHNWSMSRINLSSIGFASSGTTNSFSFHPSIIDMGRDSVAGCFIE